MGGSHGGGHGPSMAHDALPCVRGDPAGCCAGCTLLATTTTGLTTTPARAPAWVPRAQGERSGPARPRGSACVSLVSPTSSRLPRWRIGCSTSRPSPSGNSEVWWLRGGFCSSQGSSKLPSTMHSGPKMPRRRWRRRGTNSLRA